MTRFKQTLAGAARRWINGKTFDTLPELKTAFLEKFRNIKGWNFVIDQWQALRYTPSEGIEKYATKISRLTQQERGLQGKRCAEELSVLNMQRNMVLG